MKNSNVFSHTPLLNEYIADQINYTHHFSIPQLVYNTCDYYSLDIGQSSFDNNLHQIYDSTGNSKYGAKYKLILSMPIYSPSSQAIEYQATDRGITTKDTTNKTVLLDPRLNISPNIGDILIFKLNDLMDVCYSVGDITRASTLSAEYKQLSISPLTTTKEKIDPKVTDVSLFLYQYYRIVSKEVGKLILQLRSTLDKTIVKLNNLYNKDLDFHLLEENSLFVFPELEKCLQEYNSLLKKHTLKSLDFSWRNLDNINSSGLYSVINNDLKLIPEYYILKNYNSVRDRILKDRYVYLTPEPEKYFPVPYSDCEYLNIISDVIDDVDTLPITELEKINETHTNNNSLFRSILANNLFETSKIFNSNKFDSQYLYFKNLDPANNMYELCLTLKNILKAFAILGDI